jgi:hypothetical protein
MRPEVHNYILPQVISFARASDVNPLPTIGSRYWTRDEAGVEIFKQIDSFIAGSVFTQHPPTFA